MAIVSDTLLTFHSLQEGGRRFRCCGSSSLYVSASCNPFPSYTPCFFVLTRSLSFSLESTYTLVLHQKVFPFPSTSARDHQPSRDDTGLHRPDGDIPINRIPTPRSLSSSLCRPTEFASLRTSSGGLERSAARRATDPRHASKHRAEGLRREQSSGASISSVLREHSGNDKGGTVGIADSDLRGVQLGVSSVGLLRAPDRIAGDANGVGNSLEVCSKQQCSLCGVEREAHWRSGEESMLSSKMIIFSFLCWLMEYLDMVCWCEALKGIQTVR